MILRILAVGDVVGAPGLTFLTERLRAFREQEHIDFTVVNGENANVVGVTPKQADAIFAAGADVITLGNHTWTRYELQPYLEQKKRILRPANFAPQCPGRGWGEYSVRGGPICVINLMGRFTLDANTDNPFLVVDDILDQTQAKIVLVDMHAEATSEKRAMGFYLDGRVTAVWGTHTHVQTSDAEVLPEGTGYLTDLGMTGPANAVLGIAPEQSIGKFLGDPPRRYEAAMGAAKLEGAIFEVDSDTGLLPRCAPGAPEMSVRILHAADLHLDSPFEALSGAQAAQRRREQRDLLRALPELARTHGAQIILLAGDLLDSASPYPETAKALAETFDGCGAEVFLAPGNHDYYSAGAPYARLTFPENVHIFRSPRIEAVRCRSWACASGVRRSPTAAVPRCCGAFPCRRSRGCWMFCACTRRWEIPPRRITPCRPRSSRPAGWTMPPSATRTASAACSAPGTRCMRWPGCMEGRGFDETGEKGVLLADVAAGDVQARFVPVPGRRYEILRVDVTDADPVQAVLAALPEGLRAISYRIVLTGETDRAPNPAALRAALEGRVFALQLRDETRARRDLWARAGEGTLRGQFLAQLKQQYDAADSDRDARDHRHGRALGPRGTGPRRGGGDAVIIRHMQGTFGTLDGEQLRLDTGLNIIYAPNESGKSTWCAFLRAMLYGIDTSQRARAGFVPDKQKYAPWSGKPMAGELELEQGGKCITIRRWTEAQSAPMRAFSAVYTGTDIPVPGLTAADAGEQLTGVSAEVFARTAFIGQGGLVVTGTPELEQRISAIVTSGEEASSYTEADAQLRAWLRRRRSGQHGALPELEGASRR
ncbi:MAG: YmdB family metallophosphoesterase [Oscillospiraceae bacterium]